MYESVRFLQQREKERKKEGAYLDLRRTVLRKKRKRISRVAITRVPTHPLLLLLLSLSLPSSSSSRCPFVVRPRRRSPFQRRTFFIVAREKDFMKEKDEKKANAEAKKKKCARQKTRKRDEAGFFDPFFFCPFLSKSKSSSKRARFFLRFFVFLSSRSEYSFVALLVGRARARVYIYLETRDLDAFHSRDETRKRERRKENDVHERRRSRRKKGRGRKKDRIVFSEQRSFE